MSAAVTGGLVGTAAVAGAAKDVTLTVDGATRQVHTFGDTVADALDAAAVDVGSRDLVTPGLDASIHDGSAVAVRHARRVTLAVDGQRRSAWVTATSVDEALDQLGVRADRAVLSASRSRRIPRDGMRLNVELPDRVTVVARGRSVALASAAPTVRRVLAQLRVPITPADRVSLPLDTTLRDGQTIRVTRIVHQRVEQRVAAAPPVVRRPTAALYRGEAKLVHPGRVGQVARLTDITVVDGKPVKRAIVSSRVLTPAAPRVVQVGVKARASSVAGADGLNWGAWPAASPAAIPAPFRPAAPTAACTSSVCRHGARSAAAATRSTPPQGSRPTTRRCCTRAPAAASGRSAAGTCSSRR